MLPREQSGTDHGIDADGQFLAGRCLLRGAGNGQKRTTVPLSYQPGRACLIKSEAKQEWSRLMQDRKLPIQLSTNYESHKDRP